MKIGNKDIVKALSLLEGEEYTELDRKQGKFEPRYQVDIMSLDEDGRTREILDEKRFMDKDTAIDYAKTQMKSIKSDYYDVFADIYRISPILNYDTNKYEESFETIVQVRSNGYVEVLESANKESKKQLDENRGFNFGVEYRNMHDGIHRLIVTDTEDKAKDILSSVKELENLGKDGNMTAEEYKLVAAGLYDTINSLSNDVVEINYRDVQDGMWKDIKVINADDTPDLYESVNATKVLSEDSLMNIIHPVQAVSIDAIDRIIKKYGYDITDVIDISEQDGNHEYNCMLEIFPDSEHYGKKNLDKDANILEKTLKTKLETDNIKVKHAHDSNGLNVYFYYSESLDEDTEKQNGKWVNKGKEGTHGTFKTKKEADAQRKAMFANGYKAESLNEAMSNEVKKSFMDEYKKEYERLYKNPSLMNNSSAYDAMDKFDYMLLNDDRLIRELASYRGDAFTSDREVVAFMNTLNKFKSSKNTLREAIETEPSEAEYIIDYCYFDVYEDDYEEGEGRHVNSYTLEGLNSEVAHAHYKSIKDALKAIISCSYFDSSNNKYWERDARDGEIYWINNVTVDNDNVEASESEIESWKKGEIKLYACNIFAHVKKIKSWDISDEESSDVRFDESKNVLKEYAGVSTVVETYVFDFPGYYNTQFDMLLSADDKEYNKEIMDAVGKEIAASMLAYSDIGPEEGIMDIKYAGTYSPQSYNYSTDEINIDVTCDLEKIANIIESGSLGDDFESFIKERNSSHDGYISFMPTSKEEFANIVRNNGEHVADAISEYLECIITPARMDAIYDDTFETMVNNYGLPEDDEETDVEESAKKPVKEASFNTDAGKINIDMKKLPKHTKEDDKIGEIRNELERIANEVREGNDISWGETAYLQNHQDIIKKYYPNDIEFWQIAGIPEEEWNNRVIDDWTDDLAECFKK